MACHRPAVVGVEMADHVIEHAAQDDDSSATSPAFPSIVSRARIWEGNAANGNPWQDRNPDARELRTIIVTGASSGIGAYCARALKADGWRVFATARKPEDIAALEADGIEAFYLDYREPGIHRGAGRLGA